MRLGINIDHVATLRQARRGKYPDPVAAVELHTGRYCEARLGRDRNSELARLIEAAKAATKLGLRVAAGHGLDYWNVRPVAEIEEISELNIGYAIICRAVLSGMERAVRDMKELIG